MKFLKVFEDYAIKSDFGGETIYPDFFKEGGELFDYFALIGTQDRFDFSHSDPDYWEKVNKINKERKKKRKLKKKQILSYINDFVKLPENKKEFFNIGSQIIDFNLIFTPDRNNWRNRKLTTMSITTIFGTYKLTRKKFEDLVIYTSNPELYLDTKKYNL